AEAAPARGLVLHVVGQVGEGAVHRVAGRRGVRITGGRRVDDRAAVRAAAPATDALRVARELVVVVRADHVHRVGQAGRRVDVLVVPALRGADVVRRVVGTRGRLRGQELPAVVGRGE